MKLLNRVTLLSVLGISALVGTGYAAWTFSTSAENKTANAALLITDANTVGEISFKTNTAKFTLDQSGITWEGEIVADYSSVGSEVEDPSIEKSWTAAIPAELATYVTFVDASTTISGTWEDDVAIVLPELVYTENKPTTKSAYDTMVSLISESNITFTFSATIA